MKRNRIIGGLLFAVLLAASFVAAYYQPAPVDTARAACTDRGIGAEKLALLGFRGTGQLFGRRETIEFRVQGANPPKKIVVELHQWAYFLPWQVADFREEDWLDE
jgi:hypothetical protein